MIVKVYAQNCIRPKGQRIIEVNSVDPFMTEVFDEALNGGFINIDGEDGEVDDAKVDAAYDKIKKYWEENKRLECGDYYIAEVKSLDDVTIPNMVAGCADVIF